MDKKTILLFDDDPHVDLIGEWIRGADGDYLVLHYCNPADLVDDLDGGLKFDLFLTDLAVERGRSLSGVDLAQKVRNMYPDVPILTWSGYDHKPYFSRYHLTKPVDAKTLVQVLNRFI